VLRPSSRRRTATEAEPTVQDGAGMMGTSRGKHGRSRETPLLNPGFRDLSSAFRAEAVAFLFVRTHAMAAHGPPRATGQMDLLVRPSPENARRVLAAILRFAAPKRVAGRAREWADAAWPEDGDLRGGTNPPKL